MAIWRYKLDDVIVIESQHLRGIVFSNEWVMISGGRMRIQPEYAWDGCTPSFPVFPGVLLPNGLWLGVWDGPLGTDGRPVAWLASLGHDVLCQFRDQLRGVTKKMSVDFFQEQLCIKDAPPWMAAVYPFMIDKFGPQTWW